jgi:hypothetical protein
MPNGNIWCVCLPSVKKDEGFTRFYLLKANCAFLFRKLYKYEHILTISAMQQSEASHIVGECLYYLAVHRKEPLHPWSLLYQPVGYWSWIMILTSAHSGGIFTPILREGSARSCRELKDDFVIIVSPLLFSLSHVRLLWVRILSCFFIC